VSTRPEVTLHFSFNNFYVSLTAEDADLVFQLTHVTQGVYRSVFMLAANGTSSARLRMRDIIEQILFEDPVMLEGRIFHNDGTPWSFK
jgi:hypothetical protein